MRMRNLIEFGINVTFPASILILGLIGNSFGFKIFLNKKISQIGPINVYRFLFLNDILIVIQIIVSYLEMVFYFNITNTSSLVCKLFFFLNYSLSALSSMFLVYISIERIFLLMHSTKYRKLFKNKKYQNMFIIFAYAYNFIYYIPTIVGLDISELDFNETFSCTYITYNYQLIISYMDLFNRCILPFGLMISISIVFITLIFKSRRRVIQNGSLTENKKFYKDVKLSVSSILFNIYFLISNLPISIVLFIPDYYNFTFLYSLTFWLFYSGYAFNFYIFFFTNSVFRKQVYSHFKKNST